MKNIYDVPLFVNAAMNSRGRKPGEYPSAGPLAHLIDIWHCAAPTLDFISPDIYDDGFKGWVAQYHLHNNPLFIPETRHMQNNGVRAFYVLPDGTFRYVRRQNGDQDHQGRHVRISVGETIRFCM